MAFLLDSMGLTKPATNSLIFYGILYTIYARLIAAQSFRRNQPITNVTQGTLHKMEPIPKTAWMANDQGLERPGIYSKTKYY